MNRKESYSEGSQSGGNGYGCAGRVYWLDDRFAIWECRGKNESADISPGGHGLTWPIIGLSIVTANISTEQMVGMAGRAVGGLVMAGVALFYIMF